MTEYGLRSTDNDPLSWSSKEKFINFPFFALTFPNLLVSEQFAIKYIEHIYIFNNI